MAFGKGKYDNKHGGFGQTQDMQSGGGGWAGSDYYGSTQNPPGSPHGYFGAEQCKCYILTRIKYKIAAKSNGKEKRHPRQSYPVGTPNYNLGGNAYRTPPPFQPGDAGESKVCINISQSFCCFDEDNKPHPNHTDSDDEGRAAGSMGSAKQSQKSTGNKDNPNEFEIIYEQTFTQFTDCGTCGKRQRCRGDDSSVFDKDDDGGGVGDPQPKLEKSGNCKRADLSKGSDCPEAPKEESGPEYVGGQQGGRDPKSAKKDVEKCQAGGKQGKKGEKEEDKNEREFMNECADWNHMVRISDAGHGDGVDIREGIKKQMEKGKDKKAGIFKCLKTCTDAHKEKCKNGREYRLGDTDGGGGSLDDSPSNI